MSLLEKAKALASKRPKNRETSLEDIELATAFCNGEISLKQANHAWDSKSMSATTNKMFYTMKVMISQGK